MRVLLSCVPAVAHLLPLLPLGAALRRRGHEVAVVTAPGMAPLVPAGMPLLPAGPDLPELLADLATRLGAPPPNRPDAEQIGTLFGGTRVDSTVEPALAATRPWSPDLIVSESLDGVGPVLAATAGVPHASLALGPVCSAAVLGAMAAETAARGLPLPAVTHRLDPWPESLRPPGWVGPGPAAPLRTTLPGTGSPDPDVVPPGPGPAVLLTLGTLFDDPAVLQPILDALVAQGLRVACALGPRHAPSALTADPARVRVHGFRPLAEVLEAVDGVVCHGGAATVLAALTAGRPLLTVPQGSDHDGNAAGVGAAGAGLVRPADTPPAELAVAARTVTEDPAFVAVARGLRDEIAAMPSADEVAADLEGLRPCE